MENSVKRKINIFGKVGRIITTVVIILMIVAGSCLVIGGTVIAFMPKDAVSVDIKGQADINIGKGVFGFEGKQFYINAGDSKIIVGEVGKDETITLNDAENDELDISSGTRELHFNLLTVLWIMVVGAVKIGALIVALYFFKALMKAFETCDSPFCDEVVDKLRRFAFALIPCLAVSECAGAIASGIITNSFSFGSINLVYVAFVLVIFVLSMIFKYGKQKKKEHDETV